MLLHFSTYALETQNNMTFYKHQRAVLFTLDRIRVQELIEIMMRRCQHGIAIACNTATDLISCCSSNEAAYGSKEQEALDGKKYQL